MVRRSYTAEQIINKLREAEVLLSQVAPVQLGQNKSNLVLSQHKTVCSTKKI